MKTQTILAIIFAFLFSALAAQIQNVQSTKTLSGKLYDNTGGMHIDAGGNIYNAGSSTGPIDLDPGSGTYTAGTGPLYLCKLDSMGNFIWGRRFGDGAFMSVTAMTGDANGNTFIYGTYQGTPDVDAGAATYTLNSTGRIFLVKYDASGAFVWGTTFGGKSNPTSLSVDGQGNILVAGTYTATEDFDPSSSFIFLTNSGSTDLFILKLSSAGSFVWVRSVGGTGADNCNGVATDGSGNVICTGEFSGTVDFDPGTSVSNVSSQGNQSSYICKFDASGNFTWVKQIDGGTTENAMSVACDGASNIYVAGYFSGTVDFDPGSATFNVTSAGGDDAYLVKTDASGNFLWCRNTGGPNTDRAQLVKVNASGHPFMSGVFSGTADLDPGPTTYTLKSVGIDDPFFSKFDAAGVYLGSKRVMGQGSDLIRSLGFYGSAVYATGNFATTCTMQPAPVQFSLSSAGSFDVFITRYAPCTIAPLAPIDDTHPLDKFLCYYSGGLLHAVGAGHLFWYKNLTSDTVIHTGSFYSISQKPPGMYNYYVAAVTCTTSPRTVISVTVTDCTDLPENRLTEENVLIFPNPSAGKLTVKATVDGLLTIYALDGKVFAEMPINSEITLELPRGVYIARIQGRSGSTVMRKFVVCE